MQHLVTTLAGQVGVVQACAVLGVPRSGYYRQQARAAAAETECVNTPETDCS